MCAYVCVWMVLCDPLLFNISNMQEFDYLSDPIAFALPSWEAYNYKVSVEPFIQLFHIS